MSNERKEQQIIDEKLLDEAQKETGFKKLRKYNKLTGPAWLAIALNIGGATVTMAVIVASKSGFKFLWAIIPQVFTIWIICIMFTRVSLVTGLGPVSVARKYLGETAAWITGSSVFIVNTVFHSIQYMLIGIVMNGVFGVDQRVGALLGLAFVLLIVFNPGKGVKQIKAIQAILKVLVWALFLSFLAILFFVKIDWGAFFSGFIPSLPANSDEAIPFMGLLGAAIAINVPVLAAYGASQLGWGTKHKGLSEYGLTLTNLMLLLVQFIIIMAVGSTLFATGKVATNAVVAAKALEPFAGKFSTYLFSFGMLGAVLTTMVSQVLISGYIITDTLKWKVDIKGIKFKISELVVTIFGVTAPLLGWNAFAGATYGSAFNLTFAPLLILFWLIMSNKKDIMKEYKIDSKINTGIIVALLITVVAAVNFWINL